MTVGERVVRARQANSTRPKITQGELAEHLGVSQGTLSRWERGIEPFREELLPEISEFLGVPVEELIPDSTPSRQASQEIPELSDIVRTIGLILPDLAISDPRGFLETLANMSPSAQELVEQYVYMLDNFLRDQAEKSFRGFYPVPTHIDTRVVGKPPTERKRKAANDDTK